MFIDIRGKICSFLSFVFFKVEAISDLISFLFIKVKFLNSIATTLVQAESIFLEALCFYMIWLILVFQFFIVINNFQFLFS